MTLTIKPKNSEKCNGCELCLLEAQRQLKKVGLDQSLIRVFSKRKKGSEYLEHSIDVDPRVSSLDIEKIKNICPREVFVIEEEE